MSAFSFPGKGFRTHASKCHCREPQAHTCRLYADVRLYHHLSISILAIGCAYRSATFSWWSHSPSEIPTLHSSVEVPLPREAVLVLRSAASLGANWQGDRMVPVILETRHAPQLPLLLLSGCRFPTIILLHPTPKLQDIKRDNGCPARHSSKHHVTPS